jgi:hypothetical protein
MVPLGRKRLSKEQMDSLAFSLRIAVQSALGDRQPLEWNLNSWNNTYEAGEWGPDYTPWEGASAIHIPFAATQLDTFTAYIAATALVPRFYLVNGLTAPAQDAAPLIERYYNAELMRYRRHTPTWHEQHVKWLHFGGRDGMGTMQVLWRKTKEQQRIVTWNDRYDEATGMPVLDEQGRQVKDKAISVVEVDGYNDAELTPFGLRNIITIPASVTSLADAAAVAVVEYLYEDKLMELVRAGVLDKDEVEAALAYAPNGTSELTTSQQPTEPYTAGGQISLGNAQGTQVSEFFKKRGPVEVYRVHTDQYDLDGDGQVEENIVWVHSMSWRALGFMRYEYWDQTRPLFDFSPLPRLENVNGFSVIEREQPIDWEISRIWNQRNNVNDRNMLAPLMRGPGADIEDDDFSWGLNRTWDAAPGSVSVLQMPPVDPMSIELEQGLKQYGQEYTALTNTAIGQQGSSHHTATEQKALSAAIGTRMNLVVMRYRASCRSVINFVHRLNQQYKGAEKPSLDQQGARLQIPPEMLSADVQIDVAGASDPLDENTRRTENLGFGEILMKFPLVEGDPEKQWYVMRMIGESFNRPDLEQMIGTLEEAKQAKQQQQLMQATQQMAAQQGGKPGQPPQGQALQGVPGG